MPERERPNTEGVRIFGAEPARGARTGSESASAARPGAPGADRSTLWDDEDDDLDEDGLTVLDEDEDEDEDDWEDDEDLEDEDDLEDDEEEDEDDEEEDEDEDEDEDEELEDDEDDEDDDDWDDWDDDLEDDDEDEEDDDAGPQARGATVWDDDEWGDDEPAAEAPIVVATGEVELPHWTEPATGQVPAVLAEAAGDTEDDDFAAWSAVAGQPRFRSDASDWDDTAWQQGELPDDERGRMGALADEVDDDAEFEAQVRARRAGTRRVVSSTPAARAALSEDEAEPAPTRPARSRTAAGDDGGADASEGGEAGGGSGGRGRDLTAALITAGALMGIALICLVGGPVPTTGLAAVVGAVCAYEFVQGLRTKPAFKPAVPLVVTACALMPVATYNYGTDAFMVVGSVTTMATILWYLMRIGPGRPVAGVASSMLVFGYVGVFVGFVGLILAAPRNDGIGILLGAVLCTVTYDVVGYFSGTKFGRSKVAPTVSPNKSVEGTVAGMVAVVVMGMFVVSQIGPWDIKKAFVLGVAVAIAAFVGDLAESMFKRDLDLKDFGALLPGHGGFFDRFDGLIFAMPVVYFLARIFDFFT